MKPELIFYWSLRDKMKLDNGYPCKDCKDRSIEPVNCHSICEKYLSRKREREEVYLKRKEMLDLDGPFVERKIKARWQRIKHERD